VSVQLNADEYIPTQREEVKLAINKILDDFMAPLVIATIISEIKIIGAAANVPQKFVDGVKFRKTSANKGEVINTWGTEEVPLARYFNYGTSLHWVESTTPGKPLAFPNVGGTHARAIYFQGAKSKGNTMFSMGHYVSGVPRTEVMEIGYNIGKKLLAEEAGKIVQKELKYVQ